MDAVKEPTKTPEQSAAVKGVLLPSTSPRLCPILKTVAAATVFAFTLTSVVPSGWAWPSRDDQALRVKQGTEVPDVEGGLEEALRRGEESEAVRQPAAAVSDRRAFLKQFAGLAIGAGTAPTLMAEPLAAQQPAQPVPELFAPILQENPGFLPGLGRFIQRRKITEAAMLPGGVTRERWERLRAAYRKKTGVDIGGEGFRYSGLYEEYEPGDTDAFLTDYGRVWIYTQGLVLMDLVAQGRRDEARDLADALVLLGRQEEALGFQGGWHFSYNTRGGEPWLDPRAPTGNNLWALSGLYSTMRRAGDFRHLDWVNSVRQRTLEGLQVKAEADPRRGLIQAMRYTDTLEREDPKTKRPYSIDRVGYDAFNDKADYNKIAGDIVTEHQHDARMALRLAYLANEAYLAGPEVDERRKADIPREMKGVVESHRLLMGNFGKLWHRGHFVTGVDARGELILGTDGEPSVAVDNNSWLDPDDNREMAWQAVEYLKKNFLSRRRVAEMEGLPRDAKRRFGEETIPGMSFFSRSFRDRFIDAEQVTDEDRAAWAAMLQPEATFGAVQFLRDFAQGERNRRRREEAEGLAAELMKGMVRLSQIYGGRLPYATRRAKLFTTLGSTTAAAWASLAARGFEDAILVAAPEAMREGAQLKPVELEPQRAPRQGAAPRAGIGAVAVGIPMAGRVPAAIRAPAPASPAPEQVAANIWTTRAGLEETASREGWAHPEYTLVADPLRRTAVVVALGQIRRPRGERKQEDLARGRFEEDRQAARQMAEDLSREGFVLEYLSPAGAVSPYRLALMRLYADGKALERFLEQRIPHFKRLAGESRKEFRAEAQRVRNLLPEVILMEDPSPDSAAQALKKDLVDLRIVLEEGAAAELAQALVGGEFKDHFASTDFSPGRLLKDQHAHLFADEQAIRRLLLSYPEFSKLKEEQLREAVQRLRSALRDVSLRSVSAEGIRERMEARIFEIIQRTYLKKPIALEQLEALEAWERAVERTAQVTAKLFGDLQKASQGGTAPERTWQGLLDYLAQLEAESNRATDAPAGFRRLREALAGRRREASARREDFLVSEETLRDLVREAFYPGMSPLPPRVGEEIPEVRLGWKSADGRKVNKLRSRVEPGGVSDATAAQIKRLAEQGYRTTVVTVGGNPSVIRKAFRGFLDERALAMVRVEDLSSSAPEVRAALSDPQVKATVDPVAVKRRAREQAEAEAEIKPAVEPAKRPAAERPGALEWLAQWRWTPWLKRLGYAMAAFGGMAALPGVAEAPTQSAEIGDGSMALGTGSAGPEPELITLGELEIPLPESEDLPFVSVMPETLSIPVVEPPQLEDALAAAEPPRAGPLFPDFPADKMWAELEDHRAGAEPEPGAEPAVEAPPVSVTEPEPEPAQPETKPELAPAQPETGPEPAQWPGTRDRLTEDRLDAYMKILAPGLPENLLPDFSLSDGGEVDIGGEVFREGGPGIVRAKMVAASPEPMVVTSGKDRWLVRGKTETRIEMDGQRDSVTVQGQGVERLYYTLEGPGALGRYLKGLGDRDGQIGEMELEGAGRMAIGGAQKGGGEMHLTVVPLGDESLTLTDGDLVYTIAPNHPLRLVVNAGGGGETTIARGQGYASIAAAVPAAQPEPLVPGPQPRPAALARSPAALPALATRAPGQDGAQAIAAEPLPPEVALLPRAQAPEPAPQAQPRPAPQPLPKPLVFDDPAPEKEAKLLAGWAQVLEGRQGETAARDDLRDYHLGGMRELAGKLPQLGLGSLSPPWELGRLELQAGEGTVFEHQRRLLGILQDYLRGDLAGQPALFDQQAEALSGQMAAEIRYLDASIAYMEGILRKYPPGTGALGYGAKERREEYESRLATQAALALARIRRAQMENQASLYADLAKLGAPLPLLQEHQMASGVSDPRHAVPPIPNPTAPPSGEEAKQRVNSVADRLIKQLEAEKKILETHSWLAAARYSSVGMFGDNITPVEVERRRMARDEGTALRNAQRALIDAQMELAKALKWDDVPDEERRGRIINAQKKVNERARLVTARAVEGSHARFRYEAWVLGLTQEEISELKPPVIERGLKPLSIEEINEKESGAWRALQLLRIAPSVNRAQWLRMQQAWRGWIRWTLLKEIADLRLELGFPLSEPMPTTFPGEAFSPEHLGPELPEWEFSSPPVGTPGLSLMPPGMAASVTIGPDELPSEEVRAQRMARLRELNARLLDNRALQLAEEALVLAQDYEHGGGGALVDTTKLADGARLAAVKLAEAMALHSKRSEILPGDAGPLDVLVGKIRQVAGGRGGPAFSNLQQVLEEIGKDLPGAGAWSEGEAIRQGEKWLLRQAELQLAHDEARLAQGRKYPRAEDRINERLLEAQVRQDRAQLENYRGRQETGIPLRLSESEQPAVVSLASLADPRRRGVEEEAPAGTVWIHGTDQVVRLVGGERRTGAVLTFESGDRFLDKGLDYTEDSDLRRPLPKGRRVICWADFGPGRGGHELVAVELTEPVYERDLPPGEYAVLRTGYAPPHPRPLPVPGTRGGQAVLAYVVPYVSPEGEVRPGGVILRDVSVPEAARVARLQWKDDEDLTERERTQLPPPEMDAGGSYGTMYPVGSVIPRKFKLPSGREVWMKVVVRDVKYPDGTIQPEVQLEQADPLELPLPAPEARAPAPVGDEPIEAPAPAGDEPIEAPAPAGPDLRGPIVEGRAAELEARRELTELRLGRAEQAQEPEELARARLHALENKVLEQHRAALAALQELQTADPDQRAELARGRLKALDAQMAAELEYLDGIITYMEGWIAGEEIEAYGARELARFRAALEKTRLRKDRLELQKALYGELSPAGVPLPLLESAAAAPSVGEVWKALLAPSPADAPAMPEQRRELLAKAAEAVAAVLEKDAAALEVDAMLWLQLAALPPEQVDRDPITAKAEIEEEKRMAEEGVRLARAEQEVLRAQGELARAIAAADPEDPKALIPAQTALDKAVQGWVPAAKRFAKRLHEIRKEAYEASRDAGIDPLKVEERGVGMQQAYYSAARWEIVEQMNDHRTALGFPLPVPEQSALPDPREQAERGPYMPEPPPDLGLTRFHVHAGLGGMPLVADAFHQFLPPSGSPGLSAMPRGMGVQPILIGLDAQPSKEEVEGHTRELYRLQGLFLEVQAAERADFAAALVRRYSQAAGAWKGETGEGVRLATLEEREEGLRRAAVELAKAGLFGAEQGALPGIEGRPDSDTLREALDEVAQALQQAPRVEPGQMRAWANEDWDAKVDAARKEFLKKRDQASDQSYRAAVVERAQVQAWTDANGALSEVEGLVDEIRRDREGVSRWPVSRAVQRYEHWVGEQDAREHAHAESVRKHLEGEIDREGVANERVPGAVGEPEIREMQILAEALEARRAQLAGQMKRNRARRDDGTPLRAPAAPEAATGPVVNVLAEQVRRPPEPVQEAVGKGLTARVPKPDGTMELASLTGGEGTMEVGSPTLPAKSWERVLARPVTYRHDPGIGRWVPVEFPMEAVGDLGTGRGDSRIVVYGQRVLLSRTLQGGSFWTVVEGLDISEWPILVPSLLAPPAGKRDPSEALIVFPVRDFKLDDDLLVAEPRYVIPHRISLEEARRFARIMADGKVTEDEQAEMPKPPIVIGEDGVVDGSGWARVGEELPFDFVRDGVTIRFKLAVEQVPNLDGPGTHPEIRFVPSALVIPGKPAAPKPVPKTKPARAPGADLPTYLETPSTQPGQPPLVRPLEPGVPVIVDGARLELPTRVRSAAVLDRPEVIVQREGPGVVAQIQVTTPPEPDAPLKIRAVQTESPRVLTTSTNFLRDPGRTALGRLTGWLAGVRSWVRQAVFGREDASRWIASSSPGRALLTPGSRTGYTLWHPERLADLGEDRVEALFASIGEGSRRAGARPPVLLYETEWAVTLRQAQREESPVAKAVLAQVQGHIQRAGRHGIRVAAMYSGTEALVSPDAVVQHLQVALDQGFYPGIIVTDIEPWAVPADRPEGDWARAWAEMGQAQSAGDQAAERRARQGLLQVAMAWERAHEEILRRVIPEDRAYPETLEEPPQVHAFVQTGFLSVLRAAMTWSRVREAASAAGRQDLDTLWEAFDRVTFRPDAPYATAWTAEELAEAMREQGLEIKPKDLQVQLPPRLKPIVMAYAYPQDGDAERERSLIAGSVAEQLRVAHGRGFAPNLGLALNLEPDHPSVSLADRTGRAGDILDAILQELREPSDPAAAPTGFDGETVYVHLADELALVDLAQQGTLTLPRQITESRTEDTRQFLHGAARRAFGIPEQRVDERHRLPVQETLREWVQQQVVASLWGLGGGVAGLEPWYAANENLRSWIAKGRPYIHPGSGPFGPETGGGARGTAVLVGALASGHVQVTDLHMHLVRRWEDGRTQQITVRHVAGRNSPVISDQVWEAGWLEVRVRRVGNIFGPTLLVDMAAKVENRYPSPSDEPREEWARVGLFWGEREKTIWVRLPQLIQGANAVTLLTHDNRGRVIEWIGPGQDARYITPYGPTVAEGASERLGRSARELAALREVLGLPEGTWVPRETLLRAGRHDLVLDQEVLSMTPLAVRTGNRAEMVFGYGLTEDLDLAQADALLARMKRHGFGSVALRLPDLGEDVEEAFDLSDYGISSELAGLLTRGAYARIPEFVQAAHRHGLRVHLVLETREVLRRAQELEEAERRRLAGLARARGQPRVRDAFISGLLRTVLEANENHRWHMDAVAMRQTTPAPGDREVVERVLREGLDVPMVVIGSEPGTSSDRSLYVQRLQVGEQSSVDQVVGQVQAILQRSQPPPTRDHRFPTALMLEADSPEALLAWLDRQPTAGQGLGDSRTAEGGAVLQELIRRVWIPDTWTLEQLLVPPTVIRQVEQAAGPGLGAQERQEGAQERLLEALRTDGSGEQPEGWARAITEGKRLEIEAVAQVPQVERYGTPFDNALLSFYGMKLTPLVLTETQRAEVVPLTPMHLYHTDGTTQIVVEVANPADPQRVTSPAVYDVWFRLDYPSWTRRPESLHKAATLTLMPGERAPVVIQLSGLPISEESLAARVRVVPRGAEEYRPGQVSSRSDAEQALELQGYVIHAGQGPESSDRWEHLLDEQVGFQRWWRGWAEIRNLDASHPEYARHFEEQVRRYFGVGTDHQRVSVVLLREQFADPQTGPETLLLRQFNLVPSEEMEAFEREWRDRAARSGLAPGTPGYEQARVQETAQHFRITVPQPSQREGRILAEIERAPAPFDPLAFARAEAQRIQERLQAWRVEQLRRVDEETPTWGTRALTGIYTAAAALGSVLVALGFLRGLVRGYWQVRVEARHQRRLSREQAQYRRRQQAQQGIAIHVGGPVMHPAGERSVLFPVTREEVIRIGAPGERGIPTQPALTHSGQRHPGLAMRAYGRHEVIVLDEATEELSQNIRRTLVEPTGRGRPTVLGSAQAREARAQAHRARFQRAAPTLLGATVLAGAGAFLLGTPVGWLLAGAAAAAALWTGLALSSGMQTWAGALLSLPSRIARARWLNHPLTVTVLGAASVSGAAWLAIALGVPLLPVAITAAVWSGIGAIIGWPSADRILGTLGLTGAGAAALFALANATLPVWWWVALSIATLVIAQRTLVLWLESDRAVEGVVAAAWSALRFTVKWGLIGGAVYFLAAFVHPFLWAGALKLPFLGQLWQWAGLKTVLTAPAANLAGLVGLSSVALSLWSGGIWVGLHLARLGYSAWTTWRDGQHRTREERRQAWSEWRWSEPAKFAAFGIGVPALAAGFVAGVAALFGISATVGVVWIAAGLGFQTANQLSMYWNKRARVGTSRRDLWSVLAVGFGFPAAVVGLLALWGPAATAAVLGYIGVWILITQGGALLALGGRWLSASVRGLFERRDGLDRVAPDQRSLGNYDPTLYAPARQAAALDTRKQRQLGIRLGAAQPNERLSWDQQRLVNWHYWRLLAIRRAQAHPEFGGLSRNDQRRLINSYLNRLLNAHADTVIGEDAGTTIRTLLHGLWTGRVSEVVRALRNDDRFVVAMPALVLSVSWAWGNAADRRSRQPLLWGWELFRQSLVSWAVPLGFTASMLNRWFGAVFFQGGNVISPLRLRGDAGLRGYKDPDDYVLKIMGRWLVGHVHILMRTYLGRRVSRNAADLLLTHRWERKDGSVREHIGRLQQEAEALWQRGERDQARRSMGAALYASLTGEKNLYFDVGESHLPETFLEEEWNNLPDEDGLYDDSYYGPEFNQGTLAGVVAQRYDVGGFRGVHVYQPFKVVWDDDAGDWVLSEDPAKYRLESDWGMGTGARPTKARLADGAFQYFQGRINPVPVFEAIPAGQQTREEQAQGITHRLRITLQGEEDRAFPEVHQARRAIENPRDRFEGERRQKGVRAKRAMAARQHERELGAPLGSERDTTELLHGELGHAAYREPEGGWYQFRLNFFGWLRRRYMGLDSEGNPSFWRHTLWWVGAIGVGLAAGWVIGNLFLGVGIIVIPWLLSIFYGTLVPLSFVGMGIQDTILQGMKGHYEHRFLEREMAKFFRGQTMAPKLAAKDYRRALENGRDLILRTEPWLPGSAEDEEMAALMTAYAHAMQPDPRVPFMSRFLRAPPALVREVRRYIPGAPGNRPGLRRAIRRRILRRMQEKIAATAAQTGQSPEDLRRAFREAFVRNTQMELAAIGNEVGGIQYHRSRDWDVFRAGDENSQLGVDGQEPLSRMMNGLGVGTGRPDRSWAFTSQGAFYGAARMPSMMFTPSGDPILDGVVRGARRAGILLERAFLDGGRLILVARNLSPADLFYLVWAGGLISDRAALALRREINEVWTEMELNGAGKEAIQRALGDLTANSIQRALGLRAIEINPRGISVSGAAKSVRRIPPIEAYLLEERGQTVNQFTLEHTHLQPDLAAVEDFLREESRRLVAGIPDALTVEQVNAYLAERERRLGLSEGTFVRLRAQDERWLTRSVRRLREKVREDGEIGLGAATRPSRATARGLQRLRWWVMMGTAVGGFFVPWLWAVTAVSWVLGFTTTKRWLLSLYRWTRPIYWWKAIRSRSTDPYSDEVVLLSVLYGAHRDQVVRWGGRITNLRWSVFDGLHDSARWRRALGTYLFPGTVLGRLALGEDGTNLIHAPPVPFVGALRLLEEPPWLAPASGFNRLPTDAFELGESFAEDTLFAWVNLHRQDEKLRQRLPTLNAFNIHKEDYLFAQEELRKRDNATMRAIQFFKGLGMAEAVRHLFDHPMFEGIREGEEAHALQRLFGWDSARGADSGESIFGMEAFRRDEVAAAGARGAGILSYGYTGDTFSALSGVRVGPFAPGEIRAYWDFRIHEELDRLLNRSRGIGLLEAMRSIQQEHWPHLDADASPAALLRGPEIDPFKGLEAAGVLAWERGKPEQPAAPGLTVAGLEEQDSPATRNEPPVTIAAWASALPDLSPAEVRVLAQRLKEMAVSPDVDEAIETQSLRMAIPKQTLPPAVERVQASGGVYIPAESPAPVLFLFDHPDTWGWAPLAAGAGAPVAVEVRTMALAAGLEELFQAAQIPAGRYVIVSLEQFGGDEAAARQFLLQRFSSGVNLVRVPPEGGLEEVEAFLRQRGVVFSADAAAGLEEVDRYLAGFV